MAQADDRHKSYDGERRALKTSDVRANRRGDALG